MKAQETITRSQKNKFNWSIEDSHTKEKFGVEFFKTKHLEKRISQRNFSDELIQTVIDYGQAYFKQGLIFYILGECNVLNHLTNEEQKRFKNIIVIVSSKDSCILTAYRSKKPFKHIKKKSKTLVTYC